MLDIPSHDDGEDDDSDNEEIGDVEHTVDLSQIARELQQEPLSEVCDCIIFSYATFIYLTLHLRPLHVSLSYTVGGR